MKRSRIVRSIYCCGFSVVLCQAVALAQTSITPQATGGTIVPAWPDGPGFEITGLIPDSETFVILGAGGEREIPATSPGLPTHSTYIATGTVEGYIETDSLDVSNVNFTASAGTLTVNGTSAGIAPTVTNATSSVTAFAVSPTNNATYQLTSETQTCYLIPIPSGEAPPPPEQPPCGDECGDPGDPDPEPEAVSNQNQITLTQIAPFAEGSGYPTSDGGCIAFESSPISVTFTGVPHITNITQQNAYANSSGTFTVTGTNLEDSDGVSVPNFNTTITSSLSGSPGQSSENVSFSVPSTQIPGNYQFTISNMWGTSNNVTFTVISEPPQNPTADPCAVTSNPQAGYSSIVSTGTAGGSGSMAISFSGTAFAMISASVTYGPYSTPSSIAANIASLITKNYYRYGLGAKAFGSIVVYSGNTTLGIVSNAATGSSFTTTTSSTTATEAENACHSAPPPPLSMYAVAYSAYIPVDHVYGPTAVESCTYQPPLGAPAVTVSPLIYRGDAFHNTYRVTQAVSLNFTTAQASGVFSDTGTTENYGFGSPYNGLSADLSSQDDDAIYADFLTSPSTGIADCYLRNAIGKASTDGWLISPTVNPSAASVTMTGTGQNPLSIPFGSIKWNMTTQINVGSNTGFVIYSHTCYPAHQVKVANTTLYSYPSPDNTSFNNSTAYIAGCLTGVLSQVSDTSPTMTIH
jgi:hypothetical protein